MPRDLADVLHYLLPEAADRMPARQPVRKLEPASLPLIAVPIGEHDVVRAALTWNLAVEMARIGAQAAVVAPAGRGARDSAGSIAPELWPNEGVRPMGADVLLVQAANLTDLHRAALRIAAARAGTAGGVIFVRVPPLWLPEPGAGAGLLQRSLLLTSSQRLELLESYGIAKLLHRIAPGARIGVTIHGARQKGEARQAFAKLADIAARRLDLTLDSYGLLVDDLHVYQAIVAQRPIGMMHPQSPAARSLREVAELVLKDARTVSNA